MENGSSREICWSRLSTVDSLTLAFIIPTVLLIILNIMVVVGNGLVILAVIRYQRLRNVAGLLIASLAIADILVGLMVLPFSAVKEILNIWIFDSIWCHIWLAVDVWMCTSSIYNLLVIALDRFVAVTRPLNYRSLVTRKRAFFIIACAWIFSFLISFPPMIVTWPEAFNRELVNCTCSPMENSPAYIIYSSTGSFHLPFIVIFYLYYRIYLTVRDATTSASRGYVSVRNCEASSQIETGTTYPVNNYQNNNTNGTDAVKVPHLEGVVLRVHRGKYTANTDTEELSVPKCVHKRSNSLATIVDGPSQLTQEENFKNLKKGTSGILELSTRRVASPKTLKNVTFTNSVSFAQQSAEECGRVTTTSAGMVIKSKLRDQFSATKKYQRKLEVEIKAVKTVGVVTFCFVVCWLGFSIVYTLQAFSFCQENPDCVPQFIVSLFFWMGYVNSAINPLIYAACNRQYRQAFKELLICKYLRNRTSSLSTLAGEKSTSYAHYEESVCQ